VLVAWGFTDQGDRMLLAVTLGMRESYEDWQALARDLIARGGAGELLERGERGCLEGDGADAAVGLGVLDPAVAQRAADVDDACLVVDVAVPWRMTIPRGHRFEATQALRQTLTRAVSWGMLNSNPAKRSIENPQRPRFEVESVVVV
jgi:hypothetical protein